MNPIGILRSKRQRAGATRQSQSGFTFTETVIAGFMIIAALSVSAQLLIRTRANQTGGPDQSSVYQISAITGNTVTLSSGVSAASVSGAMAAVGTVATAYTTGSRCLTVSDASLFSVVSATGMPQAIQIDTGTNTESAVVSCVGAACSCSSANAQTVLLARPLRKSHSGQPFVAPAVYSAGSFSVVLTTGGLGLGV